MASLLATSYDPADAVARFVAACSLAQYHLHNASSDLLVGLAGVQDCPACADALVNVDDPLCAIDTKRLAPQVHGAASPVRIAAEAVLAALNSGDDAAIARYLDGTSKIYDTCSVCDEEVVSVSAYSPKTFRALVREPYTYRRPLLLFCDGRCCSGPIGHLSHSASTVTSICFRGSTEHPVLASIHTLSG